MAKSNRKKPVWERPTPRKVEKRSTRHLSAAQRSSARKRARRAGRRYPNLVDNMREVAKRKRATSRTRATRRKAEPARTKDPRGGLTAAGRAAFRRRDGSILKPGVKKPIDEMTPTEMKRKGSWAVRFYGRAGKLPRLRDAQGRPTRYALTAAAWGERVPATVAQARAIAAKGRRLLARAKASSS